MDNFDLFKKSTKIKLIVMSLSTLLPIIVLIVFSVVGVGGGDTVTADIYAYRYLIVVLTEGWIIWKIINYIRVLKNEEFANKRYITRTDERNKFIKRQSNSLAIKITLYILLVSLVISAFINKVICYTLLGVLGVSLLVYGLVILYYRKKF